MTTSSQPETQRLFIGVQLPPDALAALSQVIHGLRASALHGMSLVAAKNIHLTFKFLGNVDTDQIIPAVHLKRIERTGFGQFLETSPTQGASLQQSLQTDPLTHVPQSFAGVQFSILTGIDTAVPLFSLFKKTPAIFRNQSDHV